MSLQGKNVVLTGASMGIGEAIATSIVEAGANICLLSRSEDKLKELMEKLATGSGPNVKITYQPVDVGHFESVEKAVMGAIDHLGDIDILINNAGLALGAPNPFSDLTHSQITTMNNTNINGYMYMTYAVLNKALLKKKAGTILNVTSITGLEACQEAFTNAIRNELNGTDIRVLALRPGCVATNFHSQRVGHNKEMYNSFFEGFEPLIAKDIARAAVFMLEQPLNVSIKALDVVPSAQRSLTVFDRKWNERH
ncbi:hypothetical protein N7452_011024 [Penicillium brevicompactum]|uniref:Uncharacterized protein n=1 Tax=Penicillium brevicompactum TaxID=5074 RepID=A0A9W9Q1E6_PENBR|nr:hypothetical protein N7452_011024 [Penicillium brevicompactum]